MPSVVDGVPGVEVVSKKRKEKKYDDDEVGCPGMRGRERQVDAESAIFFRSQIHLRAAKTCEGKERKEEQTLSGLGDP